MANKYTKLKIDINRVVSLYRSGMTQAEIANEMGVSQKVIFSRLKEIGFKCRASAPRNQKRELNNNWKGDDVTYSAFHLRLKSLHGSPKKCEVCGTTDKTKSYDWANLTGAYEDPKDYKRMCRSCHWKYDKKHLNFKGAVGGRKGVQDAKK